MKRSKTIKALDLIIILIVLAMCVHSLIVFILSLNAQTSLSSAPIWVSPLLVALPYAGVLLLLIIIRIIIAVKSKNSN